MGASGENTTQQSLLFCSKKLDVCMCCSVVCGLTAVGVALFSGASNFVAVFVHTPTLASAAVTLGCFVVALLCTARNVRAWRQSEEDGKQEKKEKRKGGKEFRKG